jgi:hypothetical protein
MKNKQKKESLSNKGHYGLVGQSHTSTTEPCGGSCLLQRNNMAYCPSVQLGNNAPYHRQW